jgi:hypothetical protein
MLADGRRLLEQAQRDAARLSREGEALMREAVKAQFVRDQERASKEAYRGEERAWAAKQMAPRRDRSKARGR